MADTLKVLGQANPAAVTLFPLYTATGTTAAVSSIIVCNTGGVTATFRISVAVAGAADNLKQYIYYNLPIESHNTFIATIGITLADSDIIRVYASNADLAFSVFGVEIT